MSRVRVEIDLNSVREDGTTRVRVARADGELHPGQIVTAFESEDGVATLALVNRIDPSTGYAFITVDRASFREDDGEAGYDFVSRNVNRATATLTNERALKASSGARVQHGAVHRAF